MVCALLKPANYASYYEIRQGRTENSGVLLGKYQFQLEAPRIRLLQSVSLGTGTS